MSHRSTTPAHGCIRRLLVVMSIAAAAGCGSSVDPTPGQTAGGNPGGGGGSGASGPSGPGGAGPGGRGSDDALDCDEISGGANPEGEACRVEGEQCHWGWECISGDIVCESGAWKTVAYDDGVPDCSDTPPASGAACDGFCGLPSCSYTLQTPCGSEMVVAGCGPVGWSYPVLCDSDCTSYASAGACGADPACVWIGNCDGGVNQCVRNATCTPGSCPDGQTCVEMGINPCDPAALECEQCGSLVSLCLPE
jgi:hypothetical protein